MDNSVTNVYAKFDDDRLWNEKALVDRKSNDNKNPNKKNNKNNVRGHWGPISGSKNWCSKRHYKLQLHFYPRDAMHSAVFAKATCLFGCLSGCLSQPVLYQNVMISSPSDSAMTSLSGEVWLVEKFARGHSQRGRFVRVSWVQTGDFCDFSTYKQPYLEKGARYDQGYY